MNKLQELAQARDYWKWVQNVRWEWALKYLSTYKGTEPEKNVLLGVLRGIKDAEMMVDIISTEITDLHAEHWYSDDVIEL